MVKQTVHVVLRARPSDGLPKQLSFGSKAVTFAEARVGGKEQQYEFKFDQVLPQASQEETYQACAEDLIEDVLEGINATIMAYGQTGAGKTYTMTGGRQNFQKRGIIPRVVHKVEAVLALCMPFDIKSEPHTKQKTVFTDIKARPQLNYRVRVSYLEIYNEACSDLLDISTQPSEIVIKEDTPDRVAVKGLSMPEVCTEAEALGKLFEGEHGRMVGQHELNKESSRSHAIFTLHLERSSGKEGEGLVFSKLNLVDLAGSERVHKTKSEGAVLKEAGQINKSLSFLEQVILALSERRRDHIPYRSSKLTHVLQDSLGGNCKTRMIACMWSDAAQLDESLSTCRFAQRMRCISNDYSINVRQAPSTVIKKYEREILELKQELAMHDALTDRHQISYGQYSQAQKAEVRAQVTQFLQGDSSSDSLDPLQLISLRHVRELLLAARVLHQEGQRKLKQTEALEVHAAAGIAVPTPATEPDPPAAESSLSGFVGELEEGGNSVGLAPADARPGAPPPAGAQAEEASLSGRMPVPDRGVAYENFKKDKGRLKAEALSDNKAKLRQTRKQAKALALSINATKQSIDAASAAAPSGAESPAAGVEEGAAEGGADPAVSASSDTEKAGRIRDLKAQYKAQYAELQMVKSEMDWTQTLVEQCTRELVDDFDAWWQATYGGQATKSQPASVPDAPTPKQQYVHKLDLGPLQLELMQAAEPQQEELDMGDEAAMAWSQASHDSPAPHNKHAARRREMHSTFGSEQRHLV